MIVAKQGCYRAAITAERRILSLRSSDVIANVGVSWRAVRTLQYRLYFSPNIGLSGQFGFGKSLVDLGVVFKLN